MLAPSSNAYVFPLTVARAQGHGDVVANGGRELYLRLGEESQLDVVAHPAAGGWLAAASLRDPGRSCSAECATPMATAVQAEAQALAALAIENDLGYGLAHQLRHALTRC